MRLLRFLFHCFAKAEISLLEALHTEIALRTDYLNGEEIGTIYFGGGTPSILSVEEIKGILESVFRYYKVNPAAEITLEANPDTLNLDYLQGLRKLGINRLSIGIQSFFDDDLKYLSRRHDSNHAKQCINWAKQAGFDNLTLDLIYGLPTATAEKWNQNLDLFLKRKPNTFRPTPSPLSRTRFWQNRLHRSNYNL